jgi:hypothetical protein
MNNASLVWTSVSNATSYDVYFGNPLPGTATTNVATTTWTPPTMTYNATYYWKIVPKNGFGATSGSPSTWSFTVGSDPTITTFPFNEGFEGTTYAPYGWTNQKIAGTTTPGLWLRSTSGSNPTCSPHTGDGMAFYNAYNISAGGMAVLSTPPMTIPGNDYRVTFWMYRDLSSSCNTTKYSDEGVGVWYGTSPSDTTLCTKLTFIPRDGVFAPTVTTNGWYQYFVPFGAGTSGNGKYIMFKAKSQLGHNIFIDDISVQQIPTAPLPAIIGSPANNATAVALTATLNWIADPAGPTLTGFKMYFGTDNPPTNINNGTDLGYVLTYTPTLVQDGHYYWKIVPYNAIGDAVGCVVWNFYTVGRPFAATTPSPADAATNVGRNAILTWATVSTATSYDVYFGTTLPGTVTANVTSATYTPAVMTASTTYQWKVVPKNTYGDALSCPTWSFTTGTGFAYAASFATSTVDDDIGQFVFADIANPAAAPADTLYNAAATGRYTDYTSITAHVQQDQYYAATVHQINSASYHTCWVKVWIDFNQNGTFETSEQVLSGQTSASNMKVTGNIIIPADATPGNTRLRVVLRESGTESNTLATGTYSWGETEDYTCNIQYPVPPTLVYPANQATNITLMPTLQWVLHSCNGVTLSLGTNNPPTNILYEQDLGYISSWTPAPGVLEYGTRYYWRMSAYNENGSLYTDTWYFDTMADTTITGAYSLGFENSAFPPQGWTLSTTASNCWERYTGSEVHNGSACARALFTDAGTKILTSPPIVTDNQLWITWWWKNDDIDSKVVYHDTTYAEITYNGGLTWQIMGILSSSWPESEYHQGQWGTQYMRGTAQIRWRYVTDGTLGAWGVGLDDISITPVSPPLPTIEPSFLCAPVTPLGSSSSKNFTISNPTVGILSGTISYSDGLSGPTTFTQTDPQSMNINVTYTPTVVGLYSGMVNIVSNLGNVNVPFTSNAGRDTQDWESTYDGWEVYDLDADNNEFSLYGDVAHTGTLAVGCHWDSAGNNDWLVSPWYTIQAGDKLSYFVRCFDGEYPESYKVMLSTTGNTPADFTTTLLNETISNTTYIGKEINLTSYIGQTVSFAWHYYSTNMYYLFLDDIGLPRLSEPIAPTTFNATQSTSGINLTWNAIPDATSYRIYSSTDPNALPQTWMLETEVTTNSYLDAASVHMKFYKVTAVNGGRITSDFIHALSRQKPVEPDMRTKRN